MKPREHVQKTALKVTRWIGSPSSLMVHTALFLGCFLAAGFGFIDFNEMQLILLSAVSLEAIYLAIFIQMTINYTSQELEDVGDDIEEIREDVGEIQEDVVELQEDVEDISEDVEEMSEEEALEESRKNDQKRTLNDIQTDLRKLMHDIERLQKNELGGGTPSASR